MKCMFLIFDSIGNSWLIWAGIYVFTLLIVTLFFNKKINELNKNFEEKLNDSRKDLEKKIQSRFELIFGSMEDGIIITDENQFIIHANKSLRKWFELPEKIDGKNLKEVFKKTELVSLIENSNGTDTWISKDIELKFPKYSFLHIERSIIKDASGKKIGEVFVFHDQTRLFLLEKTRQEFVANVSHELRTPLTLIKGCVETLIDGAKDDPEAAEKFLQTIKKHADRITFLIEDLLTISKLESGQIQMNLQRLNLHNLVNDVIQDLTENAKAKGVKIFNTVEETMEINADYERLRQVFYNLIDNAIKYGRLNGNVWIDAKIQDNKNTIISVKDDGPGIPPEARERIFERFYRVDKARSREQGGTGLGLSIVKHIVQSHGGKVWVESQFGNGATFYFTIPFYEKKKIAGSR